MNDGELLAAKLREETEEVIEATGGDHLVWECADVVYHLMVRMQASQVTLADVERELRSRARKEANR
jgi:phosphoribosyl-ATP pyrophosphohydrolase/phosphoribosyl-AMP cyclohydrolase/histidinol dehydrogenase